MAKSGVYSGLMGALVAAALFMLIFWALARFMPVFIAFTDSRWAHLLPVFASMFIVFVAWRLYRAKRRRAA
jgi:hypothetical protein